MFAHFYNILDLNYLKRLVFWIFTISCTTENLFCTFLKSCFTLRNQFYKIQITLFLVGRHILHKKINKKDSVLKHCFTIQIYFTWNLFVCWLFESIVKSLLKSWCRESDKRWNTKDKSLELLVSCQVSYFKEIENK